jgi:hypothetical protein
MNNNVARSHLAGIAHRGVGDGGTGRPQRGVTPSSRTRVGKRRLRDKATPHILEWLVLGVI